MVDHLDVFQRGPHGQHVRTAPGAPLCAESLGRVMLADRNDAEGVDDANRRKRPSLQILAADLGSSPVGSPRCDAIFHSGQAKLITGTQKGFVTAGKQAANAKAWMAAFGATRPECLSYSRASRTCRRVFLGER